MHRPMFVATFPDIGIVCILCRRFLLADHYLPSRLSLFLCSVVCLPLPVRIGCFSPLRRELDGRTSGGERRGEKTEGKREKKKKTGRDIKVEKEEGSRAGKVGLRGGRRGVGRGGGRSEDILVLCST